jgi:hypothetical protein
MMTSIKEKFELSKKKLWLVRNKTRHRTRLKPEVVLQLPETGNQFLQSVK